MVDEKHDFKDGACTLLITEVRGPLSFEGNNFGCGRIPKGTSLLEGKRCVQYVVHVVQVRQILHYSKVKEAVSDTGIQGTSEAEGYV